MSGSSYGGKDNGAMLIGLQYMVNNLRRLEQIEVVLATNGLYFAYLIFI